MRGCAAPRCANRVLTLPKRAIDWLVKPLASGGGHRIRRWRRGTRLPRRYYLQEFVDGTPGSVVFVAAGGRAVPLGVSRQLVGEHASARRDTGTAAASSPRPATRSSRRGEALVAAAHALARAVAEEFGLVGVNGIDFVARDGVPYAIEVNPRWSASMELVERALWSLGVRRARGRVRGRRRCPSSISFSCGAARALSARRWSSRGATSWSATRARGSRMTMPASRGHPRHSAPRRTHPRRPADLHGLRYRPRRARVPRRAGAAGRDGGPAAGRRDVRSRNRRSVGFSRTVA